MTTPPADPLVGTTVGPYDILARIGGGGMGVVYSARDVRLGRLVALKFLPPQWSHDDGAKQRFIREAQAASALDHPHICTIHAIESTADGRLFIVMAHYDGRTLKRMLEDGPLDVEAAVEIAAQMAEGLAKAHAAGVVHRDIKPGNVMVSGDAVKILDFGLAKFADALQLTVEGSTLGTAAYMSPEQVRGQEADARSDVWSVGVVLYEMLAGRPPFQGAYAEAVGYAIRHEPPPPLRAARPGVPEALEQIVFRALHKEPAVRYQDARDLARALRTLQGRTLTQDLLTQPLPVPDGRRAAAGGRRPARGRRRAYVAAALVCAAAAAVGLASWTRQSSGRLAVVLAPVINQTGYAELDPFRPALTQALVAELGDSPNVRVWPYARVLETVQRFVAAGADPSSREAVRELSARSGAAFVIVPRLVYENGTWRARADVQDAATAVEAAVVETAPMASALAKDAAYALSVALADALAQHFQRAGGVRAAAPRAPSARLRTLDAARAFEEGLAAYERLEYAAAQRAFARAADEDPQHPLPQAWLSRVAQIRRDAAARAAAEAAWRSVTEDTPRGDRLFVAAVLAEARRDPAAAAARYGDLVALYPDEPAWLLEQAAFEDRQGDNAAAVATLLRAKAFDAGLARADVDLCRIYNRLNDRGRAREHGTAALQAYERMGALDGAGQARFCLTDMLRVGSEAEIAEARAHAQAALEVFERLALPYNVARAYNYVALAAEAQGRLADAARGWEQALPGARETGNSALESLVLLNLGVTYEALGNRVLALQYYRDSYTLAERLGNQRRAAQSLVNAAGIRIEYGDDPAQGFRDVQNALAVFQTLGDRNFELFCRQLMAAYHRNAGRHAEAERELRRALALAGERELTDEVAQTTVDLARSYVATGRYGDAEAMLVPLAADRGSRDAPDALLRLAQVRARLGDAAGARDAVAAADAEISRRRESGQAPLLHQVRGEIAYESGDMTTALREFAAAADAWAANPASPPHPASVESAIYRGLLEGLAGDAAGGERLVRGALDYASRADWLAIAARGRIVLARLLARGRGGEAALALLNEVLRDDGGDRTIGPELEALAYYWRGAVREQRAVDTGRADFDAARQRLRLIRDTLPDKYRMTFGDRPDVRVAMGATPGTAIMAKEQVR